MLFGLMSRWMMPLSCMNTIPETTLFIESVISQNSETKIWNYHQMLISRDMTRNLLSEHSALILGEPVLLAADSLEQLSSLFIQTSHTVLTLWGSHLKVLGQDNALQPGLEILFQMKNSSALFHLHKCTQLENLFSTWPWSTWPWSTWPWSPWSVSPTRCARTPRPRAECASGASPQTAPCSFFSGKCLWFRRNHWNLVFYLLSMAGCSCIE